jgi:cellulose synthase/poly-beta-1,6-N-acetylglucosamine synthase-like glycosyltransferase
VLLKITLHVLGVVVFFNRFIAGFVMKLIKGHRWDAAADSFEPSVTVVIPMYNEGPAIAETLYSLLKQDYPGHKLDVCVVDDCSTDDSYAHALTVARNSLGRVRVLRNPRNMGKRRSINRAVRSTSAEIIVSVDSDVVVDPKAIRQLVRRFTSPRIAAVGGRIEVRNRHVNWLSRMQAVTYYYSYHLFKNLEWGFQRIMCLSGCLTAYRRSVLLELEPLLENREILGVPIKYGEDRFLTRQIIKAGYLTTMTLDAVCWTNVPTTLDEYFSQQLRWRRSNLVDHVGAVSHVWRLNPIIGVHFFSQLAFLIAYPVTMAAAVVSGHFMHSMVVHVFSAVLFGLWYRYRVRHLPADERVSALSFLPIAFVLPVTYAFLTPVALFTLDSGSWETRAHHEAEPEVEPETEPVAAPRAEPVSAARELAAAMDMMPPVASESANLSRAQLPAA